MPAASIRSTAAISGELKISESAANIPAAASTAPTSSGTSLRSRLTDNAPSPPPRAIRGASGPITSPRPIEAKAASMTPGRSTGSVGVALSPLAGT